MDSEADIDPNRLYVFDNIVDCIASGIHGEKDGFGDICDCIYCNAIYEFDAIEL